MTIAQSNTGDKSPQEESSIPAKQTAPLPKLLVVEDDPTVLSSVARLLENDFQLLLARNGDEALSTIDANPEITVVLTDHRLPGMTGLDLLAKVQNKIPTAVRAIFSGQIDLKDMVLAINTSRLHRFILKPWDNEYFRLQMLEALAIHNTIREKIQLEQLSVTDSVTGLNNHRYFQDRLNIEFERGVRHNRPLTLLMLDIDRFKVVNDRFGHPIGDLVLKAVALRLLDQVRSIDTVARYGGEEFAIILPDTEHYAGFKVAERIRHAFERNPFSFPDAPDIRITVSIGVASLNVTEPDHPLTAQDLLAKSDTALYQAKRQGRNQTVGAKGR